MAYHTAIPRAFRQKTGIPITARQMGAGVTTNGGGESGPPANPKAGFVGGGNHFNGTDSDTGPWYGPKGEKWTSSGGSALSNTKKKFGDTSVRLPGTGNSYVRGYGDTIKLGANDFCFECWWNKDDNTTQGYIATLGSINTSWRISAGSDGTVTVYDTGAGWSDTVAYSADTWYHFALTRDGNTMRAFQDGVQFATWTTSHTDTKLEKYIGSYYTGTNQFIGYVDEVTITRGDPVYTENFTPPTEVYADPGMLDPYLGHVAFQQDFEVWGSDAYNVDDQDQTWTAEGGAAASTTEKKWGSQAGELNGTDASFQAVSPTTEAYDAGLMDFTLEFWVRPKDVTDTQYLCDFYSIDDIGIFLSGSTLRFQIDKATSGDLYDGTTVAADTWYHVALTRKSGTFYGFVDGALIGSETATVTDYQGTKYFGRRAGTAYWFNGYFDDIRYTLGYCRYDAAFTVPDAPFPGFKRGDYAVVSLLHFDGTDGHKPLGTNAAADHIDEVAANNYRHADTGGWTATVFDNTELDTSQKQFGTSSLWCDPEGAGGSTARKLQTTGDNVNQRLGTEDFTIECWARLYEAPDSFRMLFDWGNTKIYGAHNATGKVTYRDDQTGTDALYTDGPTLTTGQWYHIAFTRRDGTVYGFVDGTMYASDTGGAVHDDTEPTKYISQYNNTGYPWYGWIDEFRVTKGLARYTENFTPPTEAFTLSD